MNFVLDLGGMEMSILQLKENDWLTTEVIMHRYIASRATLNDMNDMQVVLLQFKC